MKHKQIKKHEWKLVDLSKDALKYIINVMKDAFKLEKQLTKLAKGC
jgi:hypothetical protein